MYVYVYICVLLECNGEAQEMMKGDPVDYVCSASVVYFASDDPDRQ